MIGFGDLLWMELSSLNLIMLQLYVSVVIANAQLSLAHTGRRFASYRLKSSSSVTSTATNGDTTSNSDMMSPTKETLPALTNGTKSAHKKSTDSLNNVFSVDGWCYWLASI